MRSQISQISGLNWVPRLMAQPGLEGNNRFVGKSSICSAQKLVFCDQNASEPIREVWIHDKGFTAIRLSMMRIIARRTKAATVGA